MQAVSLGLLLLLLERSLELLAALLRYVLILDVDGSGIYLGGVRLFHRPLKPMDADLSTAESPKSILTQNWPTHKR